MFLKTPNDIFQKTLAFLEELTAISSPSGDVDGLRRAAECLGRGLENAPLAVEIRDEPGAGGAAQPVLYARSKGADERYLLLVGHLDTVLPARAPERRDGRLYATGAIDMKGGLAAFVGALELLAAQGRLPPRDMLLIVVPDEEVAGPLSRRLIEEHGEHARGMWVLEPGGSLEDGETLVAARRGMFHWRLVARGVSAHAGNAYWQGRSALDAAAAWCLAARELASEGEGPTISAGRMVAGDSAFVEDPAGHADLLGSSRRVNVVPDQARVDGEARFVMKSDGRQLERKLKALADKIGKERGVEMEFEALGHVSPLEPLGLGRRWTDRATHIAHKQGWRLEIEEDRGGISFPNFLPDPGAIPILDGLGPVGDGMHTRGEYVELASLDRRIILLAEMLAGDREEEEGLVTRLRGEG